MQVISALRKAGHHVTFSMPLITYVAKQHLERIRPLLTSDDLWCCEHLFEPDFVINRFEPDIAVYCNVNLFRTVKRFAKDVVHVLDLYGPLQFEDLLFQALDPETAIHDPQQLEVRCHKLVDSFRSVDYLVTVSERQKYFWSAYCSLAGFSFADLNVLVCPVSFEVPPVVRKTADKLTVVYSGGFYPWQNPDRALRAAARLLNQYEGATLHIFGGPHPGLSNEANVHRLLDELQRSRCVNYHGYRPVEELVGTLSTAWCALELMERNIERELAITGRTVEFLSTGTPVIYNDYSTISGLIQRYSAGWTVSPSDPEALGPIFKELAGGGPELVDRLSANARRLATEQFDPKTSMSALLTLCDEGIPKRRSASIPITQKGKRADPPKVLGISQDGFAILDLRLNNPLRSLQRQGLIGSFGTTGISFDALRTDSSQYEVIVIQRTVPSYIYLALVNLGIPFILDVDDNTLARAAYRQDAGPEAALLIGLRHATIVTAPNPRLIRLLEKYSGLPLAHKAFLTPNALPYPAALRPPSEPKQLIWIQSDIAALTTSRRDVVRAVEDFSEKHQLPVVLIGRNVLERPQFKHQVVMGAIDFSANLQFLEFAPTSIGVAPLETVADEQTADFVAGKSDLKILLFDGYGHPGVYSDAPPYTDSPFQAGAQVVRNTYSDWSDALEYQYREGWKSVRERSERIRQERHIDRIAPKTWLAALKAVCLPKPICGRELYEAFHSCQEMRDNPLSTLAYLAANEDVAYGYVSESRSGKDHFQQYGRAEKRGLTHDPKTLDNFLSNMDRQNTEIARRLENGTFQPVLAGHTLSLALEGEVHRLHKEVIALRNSLSWKITGPLRKLAKPFMERNGKAGTT